MERRQFLTISVAAGLGSGFSAAPAADSNPKILALEWFRCRRDQDVTRLRDFIGNSMIGAYNRAGVKPVGAFQVSVGPDNPSFLVVSDYPSMSALEEAANKLNRDARWTGEVSSLDEKWELAYDRRESWLLRGFKGCPGIEMPRSDAGKPNLFELRIYESRNVQAHLRKVAMFDNGEIDIFRRVGIQPVFFGSTLFGPNMPNLVYMIYFPSIEARSEAWNKFGQDPEWKKISTAPGNADRETVSRISNQLMTPLPGSQLK